MLSFISFLANYDRQIMEDHLGPVHVNSFSYRSVLLVETKHFASPFMLLYAQMKTNIFQLVFTFVLKNTPDFLSLKARILRLVSVSVLKFRRLWCSRCKYAFSFHLLSCRSVFVGVFIQPCFRLINVNEKPRAEVKKAVFMQNRMCEQGLRFHRQTQSCVFILYDHSLSRHIDQCIISIKRVIYLKMATQSLDASTPVLLIYVKLCRYVARKFVITANHPHFLTTGFPYLIAEASVVSVLSFYPDKDGDSPSDGR